MPVGQIIYATVGYTQKDNPSKRKGYPIKQKYKQVQTTQSPRFPESYQLVSAQLYWSPFLALSSDNGNFIPYTVGDEYGWDDDQEKRASTIPYSNPRTTKYADFPIDTKIVYGNELYVATRYTFDWGATKFDSSINPYKSSTVRKWKKFNDDTEIWTQYWYHPLLERFYTLEELDTLLELPDFDEPSQSRWDKFTGDATDMNLKNFTLAQIKLLISTGSSKEAANALVSSIDEKSMAVIASTKNPDISWWDKIYPVNNLPKTGSFVVNQRASSGAESALPVPETLPQMIQRRESVGSGEKTTIDRYVFNLRPNNVSYSNIGVNWTEIDRVNDVPLVDYRSNKLMKISFEFVVESHSTISSLYESCEERLQQLQRMANRQDLVIFSNFDSLFRDVNVLSPTEIKYREWAIVEMSINSIQRVPAGVDSEFGAITRATVNMTVQEVHKTNDNVIYMPKLNKIAATPAKPNAKGDPELCREVATDSFADRTNGKVKYSVCWYKNRRIRVPSALLGA